MESIPDYLRLALGSESAPLQGIGQPTYLNSGPFSGQYIRVELQELQQADLGRKCNISMFSVYTILTNLRYAKVDRRPLDPPPTILLRIFVVHDLDTDRQREQELMNYQ